MIGSGQLRVPSGTSTHTLRPPRWAALSWSCTNARMSSSVRTPPVPPICVTPVTPVTRVVAGLAGSAI